MYKVIYYQFITKQTAYHLSLFHFQRTDEKETKISNIIDVKLKFFL